MVDLVEKTCVELANTLKGIIMFTIDVKIDDSDVHELLDKTRRLIEAYEAHSAIENAKQLSQKQNQPKYLTIEVTRDEDKDETRTNLIIGDEKPELPFIEINGNQIDLQS
jgi:hypothetical protein